MKKTNFLTLLLLAISFFTLISCSKEGDELPSGNTPDTEAPSDKEDNAMPSPGDGQTEETPNNKQLGVEGKYPECPSKLELINFSNFERMYVYFATDGTCVCTTEIGASQMPGATPDMHDYNCYFTSYTLTDNVCVVDGVGKITLGNMDNESSDGYNYYPTPKVEFTNGNVYNDFRAALYYEAIMPANTKICRTWTLDNVVLATLDDNGTVISKADGATEKAAIENYNSLPYSERAYTLSLDEHYIRGEHFFFSTAGTYGCYRGMLPMSEGNTWTIMDNGDIKLEYFDGFESTYMKTSGSYIEYTKQIKAKLTVTASYRPL